MPRKNPPISSALRGQCQKYLEQTHHSQWKFDDFWNGDSNFISGYGDVWVRALRKIISTAEDDDKRSAAVRERDKYKGREYLPGPSRGKRKVKSKGSKKRSKKAQKTDSESTEPPPSYQSSQEETRTAEPRNIYEQKHLLLSEDRKWCLPGGRYVEDVLFASVVSKSDKARRLKQMPKESYAHSYILDTEDPNIRALFTTEEWGVIDSLQLPLPTVDGSLESFMQKFADVKTATDLRHRLATTFYLPPDETYSRDKHGDQAWVHSVLTSLVVLYEFDHMSHISKHLEAWFQINIWGPIFDRCFQYIPNMSIARSESQSPSNSGRKNLILAPEARRNIGNKYDGLITHNGVEYGAVEDSKDFQEKKWASDSLKLVKLLHDQMRVLEKEVKHDMESLSGFQCVGFLTAGLSCQGLFLQYGKGHVCLLKRSKECKVPRSVLPLSDLIAVLCAVWQMRETVRKSVDNLVKFWGNTEVQFPAAVGQAVCLPAILPTCLDTDTDI